MFTYVEPLKKHHTEISAQMTFLFTYYNGTEATLKSTEKKYGLSAGAVTLVQFFRRNVISTANRN